MIILRSFIEGFAGLRSALEEYTSLGVFSSVSYSHNSLVFSIHTWLFVLISQTELLGFL